MKLLIEIKNPEVLHEEFDTDNVEDLAQDLGSDLKAYIDDMSPDVECFVIKVPEDGH
jgi:hypothetical protein